MFNKKYSLLICSILFLIGSFLFNWYKYDIGLLLFISLFVMLIVLFIIVVINCIKKISVDKTTSFISIIILSIMVIFNFNFPYVTSKIKVEWNKYEKARYEVVELAKNDKLGFIGDTKSAVLPDKLKKVSQTGEVLVYQNADDNLVVGFFVNRGMLSGSKILIYSTGGKKLIKKIELNNIEYIEKIKDNWYYVETKE